MAKQKKKSNDRGNSSIVHYPEPEWKKRSLEDYSGRNFQNNHQWNDSGFKDEEAQRNKKRKKSNRKPPDQGGNKKSAKNRGEGSLKGKSAGASKGKRAVKKRFYVFLTLLAAVALIAAFCGVRSLIGENGKNQPQNETGSDVTSNGGITSPGALGIAGTTVSGSAVISGEMATSGSGIIPGGMSISGGAVVSGSAVGMDQPMVPVTTDYENSVYNAIMSSYYISPIGQTKAAVVQTFGPIVRSENWNGGIYFHRKFPETMYVFYSGGLGDDGLPADTNMCTAVEIALEKIVPELESFRPISWGVAIRDESGTGWTDYYYQIAFGVGYTLTIYCDEDGVVWPDTHVLVKTR